MFLDSRLDQSSRLNGSMHTHSSIWSYVLRECTFHLFEQFIFLLYAYMAQRGTISHSCLNLLTLELHAWCMLHKTQFKWPPLLCIYFAKALLTFLFLNMSLQVVFKHQRVNSRVIQKVYINVLLTYLCSKYTLSRLCRHQAMFPQLH